VDSNVTTLNSSNLSDSFFRLSKHDPTAGFSFDAANFAGHIYPEQLNKPHGKQSCLFRYCMAA
jgi:DNA polymerase iota